MAKYESLGAHRIYQEGPNGADVYQIAAHSSGEESEAIKRPSLLVEWDAQAAVIQSTGIHGRRESTHAVDVEAVDALVAAWVDARAIQVYTALVALAERRVEMASKAEAAAYAAFAADRTKERHVAWLEARYEELAAIKAAQVAARSLGAAYAASEDRERIAALLEQERQMVRAGMPAPERDKADE